MNSNSKNQVIYISKIIIPIFIIIGLFLGGVNAGIITFEPPKNLTGEITATIKLEFGGGTNFSRVITVDNSTVFDFLLELDKTGDIIVESKETSGSYEIESIIYNDIEYVHGEKNNWWLFYINGKFAMDSADKVYVNNNDLIEWNYEKF